METDLVGEEIVDSLDSMNFLFELETALGYPLSKIDESFDDFRVGTLIDLILSEQS